MFEKEKQKMIETGIKIDRYGLIALSGGNVSWRMTTGEILVTPSGMIYEDLVKEDILVVNIDGMILEGTRKPSVDTVALRYIYKHMPNVNAIIHTHQPYATAVSLIADELPCVLTTLANSVRGSVKVCPFSSAASEQMGIEMVANIEDKLAVILKNHGVIAVGADLKQALCACVYLEEAAKTYLAARAVSKDIALLSESQIEQAVAVFEHYGQGK
ncbi:class II aldolase/adducin family protein [Anaerosinus massiliensis]|uniref:class II aldolase/adducin family protein n=1 Tax=Massilibacillus massiliensis TaxID=1806837 RepID=UPI000B2AFDAD|nr:class II aldolase/adducin family protein [Massilibacillus massiliensis]